MSFRICLHRNRIPLINYTNVKWSLLSLFLGKGQTECSVGNCVFLFLLGERESKRDERKTEQIGCSIFRLTDPKQLMAMEILWFYKGTDSLVFFQGQRQSILKTSHKFPYRYPQLKKAESLHGIRDMRQVLHTHNKVRQETQPCILLRKQCLLAKSIRSTS